MMGLLEYKIYRRRYRTQDIFLNHDIFNISFIHSSEIVLTSILRLADLAAFTVAGWGIRCPAGKGRTK